jgi:GH25 family lysozyme M1 (1,4-beta-N-acetylmuramidase)
MTLKQRIHNFFFDEQGRRQNLPEHYGGIVGQQDLLDLIGLQLPDTNRIWGIDISGRWDGEVDLSVTKRMGAEFVFIKGLDGTVPTRLYAENRARAIDAGLLHAPYQWLYKDANVSCVAQARAMYDLLQKYPATLPPVIDFEWTYWMGAPSNPTYTDLDKYLAELERLAGWPILYTAAGFTNPQGPIPSRIKARIRALFIANYGVISPTLPMGYMSWDFWQQSASGDAQVLAPNTTGKLELDLDYWRGDLQSLYEFAGTQPPTEEPMDHYFKLTPNVSGEYRSIRGETSYPSIPHIFGASSPSSRIYVGMDAKAAPTAFYVYSEDVYVEGVLRALAGDKWWKVYQANGVPFVGWVAEIHLGARWLNVQEIGAPAAGPAAVPFTFTIGDDITYKKQVITGTVEPV